MLDKKKYTFLYEYFDKTLLHKEADEGVIANVGLHILREHPDFTKAYCYLFSGSRITIYFKNIILFSRYTCISAIKILRSVINKRYWFAGNEIQQSDVLFVSHLINEKLLTQKTDFYFHDMPWFLNRNSIKSSIVFINHIKKTKFQGDVSMYKDGVSCVYLSPLLDVLSEIKIYIKQWKSALLLKKIICEIGMPDNLKSKALLSEYSSDTANTLRIAKQIAKLVGVTQAKYLFVTYEGHAWERVAFSEARKINPKIICIGYQHALISKSQHGIKRMLKKTYDPNVVLTAGRVSERQLKLNLELSLVTIKCLGSVKSNQNTDLIESGLNACLVVPEGILSECLLLFEFSVQCAIQNPRYKFIWRLHPLMNFRELSKRSKIFCKLPNNIILSKESLAKDLTRCDTVLYRGSTVVVEAISKGLKPIYFVRTDEMIFDPIYRQACGKSTVSCVSEFSQAVKVPLTKLEKLSLSDYAKEFYTPINYSVLRELCS